MNTQTLISYLLQQHDSSLTLYDLLENYCSRHDLTLDQTEPLPADADEHDQLLYKLLHWAANQ